MINIYIDKSFNSNNELNVWSYNIDSIEKDWYIDDDEEIEEEAEDIMQEYGLIIMDEDEYNELSEEEKNEGAKEFLKILFNQYKDLIEKHIIFISTKSINLSIESYFHICFNLIANKANGKTTLGKLYQWKNTAINHKYLINEATKSVENYFKDYIYLDIGEELFLRIIFYKEQWDNIINYFINLINKKIDEYDEGKDYELYK